MIYEDNFLCGFVSVLHNFALRQQKNVWSGGGPKKKQKIYFTNKMSQNEPMSDWVNEPIFIMYHQIVCSRGLSQCAVHPQSGG